LEGKRDWAVICSNPVKTVNIAAANHYFMKTHAEELAGIVVHSL